MKHLKFDFEASQHLKQFLAPYFEKWKKQHGGDLDDLAERCGVTTAYLSHVRRYGRIPSRSVLILLALNFGIDGATLFEAAEIKDTYPFESGLEISRPDNSANNLLSMSFNTEAFTEIIRSVVRSEMRRRSVKDLLGSRPLKIGVNYHQYWMFGSTTPPTDGKHSGIFPEFCKMLGIALQRDVELVYVPFSEYLSRITSGQIDLFGPTMIVPNLPVEIPFSIPLHRLGISALFRKRESADLPKLPEPKDADDLHNERYRIVVLRNSLPHLICNTLLKRSDSSLILCSSDEEGLDRMLLRGVSRPAHLFVTNSITALNHSKNNKRDLALLFATRDSLLDLCDNGIAVRPDWPELVPTVNDAIRFLHERGGFSERLKKLHVGEMRELVEI